MAEETRLGDIVDDYCSRCRLIMNHAVVSMIDGDIKKVRCTTCQHDHDYRHGKGGRKKKDEIASLIDQLTASMPYAPSPPPRPKDKKTSGLSRRRSR